MKVKERYNKSSMSHFIELRNNIYELTITESCGYDLCDYVIVKIDLATPDTLRYDIITKIIDNEPCLACTNEVKEQSIEYFLKNEDKIYKELSKLIFIKE